MHSFKQLYMSRLLRALHGLGSTPVVQNSSLAKRRRAVKMAADLSLALTAKGSAWSDALINNTLSGHAKEEILAKNTVAGGTKKSRNTLMGRPRLNDDDSGRKYNNIGSCRSRQSILQKIAVAGRSYRRLPWCSPRICRRDIIATVLPASTVARKLVRRRTKLLQSLIPGGKSMDSCCLLTEAADYIVSLKAQVEVMQFLTNGIDARCPPTPLRKNEL